MAIPNLLITLLIVTIVAIIVALTTDLIRATQLKRDVELKEVGNLLLKMYFGLYVLFVIFLVVAAFSGGVSEETTAFGFLSDIISIATVPLIVPVAVLVVRKLGEALGVDKNTGND